MGQHRKKHIINSQTIIHCPTGKGVRKASERAREWAQRNLASEASSPEQVNEWVVRANEQTDERVAQYLHLYSCLFQTTVHSPNSTWSIHFGFGNVMQRFVRVENVAIFVVKFQPNMSPFVIDDGGHRLWLKEIPAAWERIFKRSQEWQINDKSEMTSFWHKV